MRNTFFTAAAVALGACAGTAAEPGSPGGPVAMPVPIGVDVQNFDRSYEVRGRTATELNSQVRTLGPTSGGQRWAGEMTWSLRYRYASTVASIGGCTVRDLRVSITNITTMPQWADAMSGDSTLRAQWSGFIAALRTHEEGHRRIALEAAIAIKRRLEDLRGSDCRNYAREAQVEFDRLLAEYNARNADYDATTRHGFTQGALWPPRLARPAAPPPGSR